MPSARPSGRGRGFFSEDRRGLRVTEPTEEPAVTEPVTEPFEDSVVLLVMTDDMLPLGYGLAYGLPLASGTDTPVPAQEYIIKSSRRYSVEEREGGGGTRPHGQSEPMVSPW